MDTLKKFAMCNLKLPQPPNGGALYHSPAVGDIGFARACTVISSQLNQEWEKISNFHNNSFFDKSTQTLGNQHSALGYSPT